MNNRSFFFEIKDIITQFIAALDDTIIARYDNSRNKKEDVEVRYVYAPKQRVMYDIVNKAQNLTLPVVTVDIASVSRDPSRVFNKLESTYLPVNTDNPYGRSISKIPAPIPINIEVNVSILTRYMNDMDQILSNFVPYSNPYIILSWPLPSEYGTSENIEIRSEVLWSGSLAYNTPKDTTYSDKFRCVVDTSFTIKSWLFKEITDTTGIIYKVDANFYNLKKDDMLMYSDDYYRLSSYELDRNFTDSVTVSALPTITNLFWSTTGWNIPVTTQIIIKQYNPNQFIIYGTRFDYNNTFYLSSTKPNFLNNYVEIDTAKSATISAYNVTNYAEVISDNIFTLNFPVNALSTTGDFTIVTANSAGWASSIPLYSTNNLIFYNGEQLLFNGEELMYTD